MAGKYWTITSAGNLAMDNGPATLVTVNVNTALASAVFTIYDNTTGAGTKIATIDASTGGTRIFAAKAKIGLYGVLSGANADITVVTQ